MPGRRDSACRCYLTARKTAQSKNDETDAVFGSFLGKHTQDLPLILSIFICNESYRDTYMKTID